MTDERLTRFNGLREADEGRILREGIRYVASQHIIDSKAMTLIVAQQLATTLEAIEQMSSPWPCLWSTRND